LLFAFGMNCALRFLLPSYSQRWGFVHPGHPRGERHTAYGNLVSRYYYGPHSLMNTKMHMSILHLFFLTYIILDPLFFPGYLCPKEQDRRCYTLCGSDFTGRIISDWSAISFRFFFFFLPSEFWQLDSSQLPSNHRMQISLFWSRTQNARTWQFVHYFGWFLCFLFNQVVLTTWCFCCWC
jgi:hypothetical protein